MASGSTDMPQQFGSWSAQHAGVAVKLERVEDETTLVLVFGVEQKAVVSILPMEDGSFFAELLDEETEELDSWISGANVFFADRSKLTLDEVLNALVEKAPKSLVLTAVNSDFDGAASRDLSMDLQDDHTPDDDEDDFDFEDDMLESAVIREVDVEDGTNRDAQRAASSQDYEWESMVASNATQGSRQASQVLMREMRHLLALKMDGNSDSLEVELIQDSLYRWKVTMHASGFPEDCGLKEQLVRFGKNHPTGLAAIVMDVTFPSTYPMEPPFIRIIRPRFKMHTGHVTVGGSVCMQLLTPSGWLPSVSLENIFVSIRSEMIEGGGQLESHNSQTDYTFSEARQAFNRVAARYGWK